MKLSKKEIYHSGTIAVIFILGHEVHLRKRFPRRWGNEHELLVLNFVWQQSRHNWKESVRGNNWKGRDTVMVWEVVGSKEGTVYVQRWRNSIDKMPLTVCETSCKVQIDAPDNLENSFHISASSHFFLMNWKWDQCSCSLLQAAVLYSRWFIAAFGKMT